MTIEELVSVVLISKKIDFKKRLLAEKLIRYSTTNTLDESLDNFELTEKAIALLQGNTTPTSLSISAEQLAQYLSMFKAENIGINKTSHSPSQIVRKKLESFIDKYNIKDFSIILQAVSAYHISCINENRIQYSSDAQYFIEKDGGSLLLDTINSMNNTQQSYYKLV
jgi:hypothetical protein